MHFTCFTLKKIGQASTWRKYKLYIRVQLNEIYHVGCFLFSFENFVWPPFCFFPTRMRVCERHRFTLDSWSITPREPKSIIKKWDYQKLTSFEIMTCLFSFSFNIWFLILRIFQKIDEIKKKISLFVHFFFKFSKLKNKCKNKN